MLVNLVHIFYYIIKCFIKLFIYIYNSMMWL
nr:MAG TPA: protein of unknown function (DUF5409) [Bacteriophage sp.]